ncbi:MAG TPA: multicopper oxidase domain-containing protein [Mycobacteriales bacterium]|nr:multicopper oxidase domain-containing protein [Mycobacteriales bacterium]
MREQPTGEPTTPEPATAGRGGKRAGRYAAVGGAAVGVAVTLAALLVATTGTTTGATGNGAEVGHRHATGAAPGRTRTVPITIARMRFQPAQIRVAAGTHLVLRLTNRDAMAHDLRLDTGQQTQMLAPDTSATLDAGVVTHDVDGWCTVPGHRAAGMTLTITATGTDAPAGTGSVGSTDPTGRLDLSADPPAGWTPRNAVLPPAPPGRVHRVKLHATEHRQQVAPGVGQTMWTFGGTAPGPTLRGKVGDRFVVTLVNDSHMGHSIDFHASSLAPDGPMRTIAPGQRLVYRFTAHHAGIWLYHCATQPMLMHIGNGMYGAVIIDPPGLRPVDREFVLVGSELYLGQPGSPAQLARMDGDRPDGWMFNGMAAQYQHAPLTARAGQRVRFWVLDAGPNDPLSFHLVGTQFDTVYKEGAWLLRPSADAGGSQALDLAPAQGGFVETVLPGPGRYPFIDHIMRHAQGGASGRLDVRP